MIATETLIINGREFIRTYSDSGYQIRQNDTGVVYDEAIDPADAGRTYTETDELVENGDATESDYINALAELGVTE